jgi:ABC-type Fe3+/spermidine/putrescine transport system ATPase subunit
VFVTHDQTEAAALGDRVIVMKDGVVVQNAAPEELFASPATRFVADFLGIANLFPFRPIAQTGPRTYRGSIAEGIEVTAELRSTGSASDALCVWFRPEALQVLPDEPRSEGRVDCFQGEVLNRSFTGTDYVSEIAVKGFGALGKLIVSMRSEHRLQKGERVLIGLRTGQAQLVRDDIAVSSSS